MDAAELANARPELGGATFERLLLEGAEPIGTGGVPNEPGTAGLLSGVPSGATRVRWYVAAKQLRLLLEGSGDPTLSARIVTPDGSWLAQAVVPGVPAAALAPVAPPATDAALAPTAPSTDASLPARFEVRGGIARAAGARVRAAGRGRVTLRLVSPSGRVVARLVVGTFDAGWHTATLPASLTPGLYFVDAQAAGARAHAKVLITR